MTEDGQNSQWVPSGPELDENKKLNVHTECYSDSRSFS